HVGIHLPEDLASTGPLTLSITTLEGKLVLRQQVPTSIANEVEVDVSRLASGAYALHLSDGTRWLAGSKFVVQ
ncbi:MAG: T9SS type A sorting domain-containing protein, partial [Bacteroidetes bacterium]|nr:T9SS type A sorting domain-containing protein [Bacteroidota bacterium]